MENPLRFPVTRRTYRRVISVLLAACWTAAQGRAQEAPAKSEAQPAAAQTVVYDSSEVSTRDTPPTFRVRVNLFLVRVVVRANDGKVFTEPKKENFQLAGNPMRPRIS